MTPTGAVMVMLSPEEFRRTIAEECARVWAAKDAAKPDSAKGGAR